MTSDHLAMEALRLGLVRVEADGSVWRVRTRSRTGAVRPCEPVRVDRIENTGYRRVRLGKRGNVSAHRLVWIAFRGAIAEGLEVNHKNLDKIDNRLDNLELVSHPANVHHAYAAGAVPPLRGEENGQSRLTLDDVAKIRALAADGKAKRAIARSFGVSPTLIRNIVRGTAWQHAAFPGVRRG